MKKIIFSILTVMVFSISSLMAQNVKALYDRYSGEKGVSAIYISPSMFKMLETLPEVGINGTDVQFGNIIHNFTGMYVMSVAQNHMTAQKISAEISEWLKKGTFEILMETKDAGGKEHVRICVQREKEIIKEFLLFSQENDGAEVSLIFITGDIPENDLAQILKKK